MRPAPMKVILGGMVVGHGRSVEDQIKCSCTVIRILVVPDFFELGSMPANPPLQQSLMKAHCSPAFASSC